MNAAEDQVRSDQANGTVPPANTPFGDLPSLDVSMRGVVADQTYIAAIRLLSQSKGHRTLPVGFVDAMLRKAIELGQVKLYQKSGVAFGFAFWAYLNEKVETRLLGSSAGLKPDELKIGDRLWVVDIVAPFGGFDEMRTDLAAALFKSRGYRELPRPDVRPNKVGAMSVSTVNPSLTYRPAQREDIAALAPCLRRQDLEEIFAATGRDAVAALTESFDNAKRSWTALLNDRVIAMLGVGRIRNRPQDGRIWMLGSDEVFRQRRALLHDGPAWLREMIKGHAAIGNYVDVRNEAYIRWLKRLGFRFARLHEEFGFERRPFWEFFITSSDLDVRIK